MKAYDPEADTPVARARRVAVVGGGNVAMDSARTALRMGADEVFILYRRSEEEMPARREEIHHAVEEGIVFELLAAPVRYLGDEEGRVRAVECIRMRLGEPDNSGRRRPAPIPGSEFTLEIDAAVVAIGNGPNPLVPKRTPGLQTKPDGKVVADPETGATSRPGVFAAGDLVLGAATVILAMGGGRRAAKAIHEYLSAGEPQRATAVP
jgi:glutamate synthase (NADPH/NADH) small chain